MPRVKIKNNINLYYEEYGQGDPIVFVAGFTADHSAWDAVAKICAAKYRVIVFDNRGVGQSDCPDFPYTAELLADDVKALCEVLGIKQAYFVGNSMGGQIVMALAHRHPALIKAIVISNAVMKSGSFLVRYQVLLEAHLALIRLSNAQKEFSTKAREIFARTNLGWIFSSDFLNRPGMIEQQIKWAIENKYPITESGFINQMNVFKLFDASAWLHEVYCPSLVVASEKDGILPPEEVRAIAQIIPDAQYFSFVGEIGHLPHVEQPDEFARLIFDFIATLS
ncbi:MAG: hypothetical protein A2103_05240 [Gammaproteobacteria bacterium GWF2_41_13]|nr:MAG: hypothetical protein A2103_05240 [Gammaproteobacteria bacterium GWF2_41_13]